MKALITGATSGIGREFAIQLSDLGYDLILVSRNKKELIEIKNSLKTKVDILSVELSNKKGCYEVYEKFKEEKIDLFINNAGVGVFGEFSSTNLEDELEMINLNLITPHILTKLFLKEFIKRDKGYILNVASTAAFTPGPLMASYYATKSYLFSLSSSIYEELRIRKSNVKIKVLCPGPANTNFNNKLGIKFGVKALTSNYVVKYTLKKLYKSRFIIIPGFTNKLLSIFVRIIPLKVLLRFNYKIQAKKVIK